MIVAWDGKMKEKAWKAAPKAFSTFEELFVGHLQNLQYASIINEGDVSEEHVLENILIIVMNAQAVLTICHPWNMTQERLTSVLESRNFWRGYRAVLERSNLYQMCLFSQEPFDFVAQMVRRYGELAPLHLHMPAGPDDKPAKYYGQDVIKIQWQRPDWGTPQDKIVGPELASLHRKDRRQIVSAMLLAAKVYSNDKTQESFLRQLTVLFKMA